MKAGTSVNARNIAVHLEVSPPAVSKALPLLEKGNYISVSKDKDSKRLSISLNRDNSYILWLKRADNLKQLYESKFVQILYNQFPEATVIVFGSYAFGEDTATSDIDLAIIGAKEKELNLKTYEKVLERSIRINYYNSFQDLDKHFLNNLLNGIILKGGVEL
jgi:predicted nucleotidyltransferase